jgi:hypothetical protein
MQVNNKLVVGMVNVLGYRDDQCTKYATLTTSAEKIRKHGKGVKFVNNVYRV